MAIATTTQYSRTNWKNGGGNPIDDRNLNKIEKGIVDIVNAVNENANILNSVSENVTSIEGDIEDVQETLASLGEKDTSIEEEIQNLAEDTQSSIQGINDEIGGIQTQISELSDSDATNLATAKGYTDTKVGEEKSRAELAEKALSDRINTEKDRLDAFLSLDDGETLDETLDSLIEIQKFLSEEAADAEELISSINTSISTLNGEVGTIKGHVNNINKNAIFANDTNNTVVIDCGCLG